MIEEEGKVNCVRKCGRLVRGKVKWNTWHMKTQLRCHLGGCFVLFFGLYFAIVLVMIRFLYVK